MMRDSVPIMLIQTIRVIEYVTLEKARLIGYPSTCITFVWLLPRVS